jgi:O-antigen/teichoic acid export membrane protein
MAGEIKTLAKETAIYGISSIVGKFLNWLLTPLWSYVLVSQAQMGVLSNLYGWTALMIVILTYGMETGLFRFANKNEENPRTVYSTTLISIGSTTVIFLLLVILFLKPITGVTGSPDIKPHYVLIMAVILSMDAFCSIPFAWLRYQKRPLRFAFIKILFIVLNITFNLFFFVLCPWLAKKYPDSFTWFTLENGVDYVLISNLLATFIQSIFLIPQLRIKYTFDKTLLKRMLRYSLPLLVLGVAGILNQTIDKIIFPWLYPDKANAMIQLGIYSACFKIGVIMVMFTQAFRYAFEPFIFAKSKDSASNRVAYADATKYFILFGLLIFLGVMGYLDVVKYLIKSTYHEGLIVVPIVMMGELFFGIYFNLSLWYKLTDQTKWGAYLSLIGLVVTLAINFAFIPRYGYLACAWASFFANLVMMVFSYFLGQKNYSIDYDLKTIGGFFALALTLFAAMGLSRHVVPTRWPRLFVNTLLIVVYLWMVIKKELPLREVPVIGKYFQKK